MTQLFRVLKETAIFMLGAQVLAYLGPGKKYEKYSKMIVSILILAQLAEPVLSFGENLGMASFSSFLKEYEAQNAAFLDRMDLLDENSDRLVWEGLVMSVEEQLTGEAKKMGVRIERVTYGEGRVLVEVGNLNSEMKMAVTAEELKECFSEKLGIDMEHLEVTAVE